LKNQLLNALSLSLAAERVAGIAHQLNNNLTPAMYHADKISQQGNLDNKTRQSVTTIQNCLNLSHESISAILSLSRPAVPSIINANQMVSELFSQHHLADELRLNNIEVVQRFDPGMVEITGYRVLLQQALANVIKNAQEAMAQTSGGGRLMVLTEATPSSITIRISDDGPGIPEDELKKLFEPRFTSKSSGEGSGLGLYFSREVIKRHEGSVEVKSRPGDGATFIIKLPVSGPGKGLPVTDAGDPLHHSVFAEMSKADPNPGENRDESVTGRILVIDDEPEILEMLTDILSADGHSVTTSLDTIDALKKIRSAPFDCVVCDIRMPDIDAPELSRIIKEHDRDLWDRLVFITGDIVNRDNATFIQETGVPCIEKPFAAEQVQALLRGVLSPRRN
jgi:CheY-like chemotaxis protein/anti-sigma regulatory factor (Ser/Thr protein kinase)